MSGSPFQSVCKNMHCLIRWSVKSTVYWPGLESVNLTWPFLNFGLHTCGKRWNHSWLDWFIQTVINMSTSTSPQNQNRPSALRSLGVLLRNGYCLPRHRKQIQFRLQWLMWRLWSCYCFRCIIKGQYCGVFSDASAFPSMLCLGPEFALRPDLAQKLNCGKRCSNKAMIPRIMSEKLLFLLLSILLPKTNRDL